MTWPGGGVPHPDLNRGGKNRTLIHHSCATEHRISKPFVAVVIVVILVDSLLVVNSEQECRDWLQLTHLKMELWCASQPRINNTVLPGMPFTAWRWSWSCIPRSLVDLYAGLSVIVSLYSEGWFLFNFLNKPSPWWATDSVDIAAWCVTSSFLFASLINSCNSFLSFCVRSWLIVMFSSD